MPSTTSSSFCRPEPSSTVITPSLPTFSIASAMVLPIDSSEFAEIVPTWAIALESLQGLESFFSSSTATMTPLSMPRLTSIGLRPEGAALRAGLQALADDRLREHGGSRCAVAGLIGGVGSDFLHHLRAHVLEFVL